jgi:transcription elongation factor Elf1
MLFGKNKLTVINILDTTLGVGSSLKGNEQAHHCPFCNHHKKKLQVNLDTQRWHCWVCDSKGRSIQSLLRKLNVDIRDLNRLKDIYGEDDYTLVEKDEYVAKLQLPSEFKQLHFKPNGFQPEYNQAINYLKERGITQADIVKYNIGYCSDGLYFGRIIVPSYDENGDLNYFVARSYYTEERMKYKNPPVNRDVIVFENQINWKALCLLSVENTKHQFGQTQSL